MEKKNKKSELDEVLFHYLQEQVSEEKWEKLLREYDIKQKDLEDMIDSHFYLAPANLKRSQWMLALLVIFISLTITMVRVNNDWAVILFTTITASAVALPFLLVYLLMRAAKNLDQLRFLAFVSLFYGIFATILFIAVALSIDLAGSVLIPIIIAVLYAVELGKLTKLIRRLNNGKPSSTH
jgi:hypothetical protein